MIAADWGSAPLGREPRARRPPTWRPPRPRAPAPAPVKRRAVSALPAAAPAAPPAADRASPGASSSSTSSCDSCSPVSGDGGQPVQISHTDSNHEATQPDLSPDGRHIVFTVFTNDGSAPGRTWIMDADGSNAHPLTAADPGYEHSSNEFTPDGRRLVFARCNPEVCAIWSSDLEGRNLRRDHADPLQPDGGGDRLLPDRLARRAPRRVHPFLLAGVHLPRVRRRHRRRPRAAHHPGVARGGPAELLARRREARGERLDQPLRLEHLVAPTRRVLAQATDRPPRTPGTTSTRRGHPTGRGSPSSSDRRYADNCCVDVFAMRTDGLQEHQVPTGARRGMHRPRLGSLAAHRTAGPSAALGGAGGSAAGSCAPAPLNRGLPACSPVPDTFAAAGPSAKGRRSGLIGREPAQLYWCIVSR